MSTQPKYVLPTSETPSAEAALARLYTGESLAEAEAEALFAELVAGPAPRAHHRRHADRASPQGRDRRGADRRRPGASRRRRRFPAARLSVRRQLRHRRRRLGLDQRLDRRRLRRRRGRAFRSPSTATARSPRAAARPTCSSSSARSSTSAPSVSRRALDETGICFLFAPLYHPGLRHAGPVRRMLKVRTIMNMLGPCVNPAEPKVQLLGVADPALLEPVARTLAALGRRAGAGRPRLRPRRDRPPRRDPGGAGARAACSSR